MLEVFSLSQVTQVHWVSHATPASCLGGSTTSCKEFLGCGSPKEGALCWMLCHLLSASGSFGHLLLLPAASLSFGLHSLAWGLFFSYLKGILNLRAF